MVFYINSLGELYTEESWRENNWKSIERIADTFNPAPAMPEIKDCDWGDIYVGF